MDMHESDKPSQRGYPYDLVPCSAGGNMVWVERDGQSMVAWFFFYDLLSRIILRGREGCLAIGTVPHPLPIRVYIASWLFC
jgi:hypothetical protein